MLCQTQVTIDGAGLDHHLFNDIQDVTLGLMLDRFQIFKALSEYNPVYRTLRFSDASPMHLRSSSMYSDALCIRLRMLHNSALPPASVPPHMLPPLVCLFVYLCHWCTCCLFCLLVSPSRLVLLIDGQWTSAKSDCAHSIRRGLGRGLRSSLLLNSSPRCNPPCRIVY